MLFFTGTVLQINSASSSTEEHALMQLEQGLFKQYSHHMMLQCTAFFVEAK